jgi:hypothetical protein
METEVPSIPKRLIGVTIDTPIKVEDGINTYITYPIKCHDDICIHHRYSDFEWLQSELISEFPWIIVPSIPEKAIGNVVIGTELSSRFYDKRRRGLELFLNRVL